MTIEASRLSEVSMEVFARARIASRCFLSEALLWILVQRVPAVTMSDDPEEWWQEQPDGVEMWRILNG